MIVSWILLKGFTIQALERITTSGISQDSQNIIPNLIITLFPFQMLIPFYPCGMKSGIIKVIFSNAVQNVLTSLIVEVT